MSESPTRAGSQDLRAWIGRHEAISDGLWREQTKWNDATQKRLDLLEKKHAETDDRLQEALVRMAYLQGRIAVYAAIGAGVGGVATTLMTAWILNGR